MYSSHYYLLQQAQAQNLLENVGTITAKICIVYFYWNTWTRTCIGSSLPAGHLSKIMIESDFPSEGRKIEFYCNIALRCNKTKCLHLKIILETEDIIILCTENISENISINIYVLVKIIAEYQGILEKTNTLIDVENFPATHHFIKVSFMFPLQSINCYRIEQLTFYDSLKCPIRLGKIVTGTLHV